MPKNPTKLRPPGSLKQATSDLIWALGGPTRLEGWPELPRRAQLTRYADPDEPDHAPVNVVATLERELVAAGGEPHVTRWLAAHAGYVLFRVSPDLLEGADALLAADMATVCQEVGAIQAEWGRDVADLKIDAAERRRLLALAQRGLYAYARLVEHLTAQVEADRKPTPPREPDGATVHPLPPRRAP